jgi:hypothetical protein
MATNCSEQHGNSMSSSVFVLKIDVGFSIREHANLQSETKASRFYATTAIRKLELCESGIRRVLDFGK